VIDIIIILYYALTIIYHQLGLSGYFYMAAVLVAMLWMSAITATMPPIMPLWISDRQFTLPLSSF
jgi:hypothetical protein